MNCEVCPHARRLEEALRFCKSCGANRERASQRDRDAACLACVQLKEIRAALKPCGACDSGRLHGTLSLDASPSAPRALALALPMTSAASPSGVTDLPTDTEDALRVALATIFSFSPIEILLLRHTLSGGNYATFTGPLRELRDRLLKYDLEPRAPAFRSLVDTWVKRMIEKYPPLARYFKESVETNRTRNAEHLAQLAAR